METYHKDHIILHHTNYIPEFYDRSVGQGRVMRMWLNISDRDNVDDVSSWMFHHKPRGICRHVFNSMCSALESEPTFSHIHFMEVHWVNLFTKCSSFSCSQLQIQSPLQEMNHGMPTYTMYFPQDTVCCVICQGLTGALVLQYSIANAKLVMSISCITTHKVTSAGPLAGLDGLF